MISRKKKIIGGEPDQPRQKDEDEIFRLSKHLDHIYIRIHSIFAGVDFKPDPLKLSKPRTERLGDQESVDYMNISKLLSFLSNTSNSIVVHRNIF